jgi:hypothetical protein
VAAIYLLISLIFTPDIEHQKNGALPGLIQRGIHCHGSREMDDAGVDLSRELTVVPPSRAVHYSTSKPSFFASHLVVVA